MKIVITYGTFDLFHVGHLNILKRAKKLGDYLIVGLSTDKFNKEAKDKHTVISYEDRKEILESLRFVDLVIPEYCWEQKKQDIQYFRANIFVMGHDWEGKFDELKEFCKVVYLPRTESISSSDLKKHISITPHKRFERI